MENNIIQCFFGTIILVILIVAGVKLSKALKIEKEKLNNNNN